MMTRKLFRDLFLLIALFGGIALAYVLLKQQFPETFSFGSDREDKWEVLSPEKERELGKVFMEYFVQNELVVRDPSIDTVMQEVYDRLLAPSGIADSNIHFHIVRDNTVNALTLPGGNVLIFTGLIEFCEGPEELAAVIAHELGHVYHRHVVDKLVREFGLSILVSVVTGGDPGLVHELSKVAVSSIFSRRQESEADAYALRLLVDAKVHPGALARFFEALNEEDLSYNEALEWLMSHPHNDQRIGISRSYRIPPGFEEKPFVLDWNELVDRI